MNIKHNFVQLAEVQKAQKTLYCAGLDPHSFGSPEKNKEIYKDAMYKAKKTVDTYYFYLNLLELSGFKRKLYDGPFSGSDVSIFASMLMAVETYLRVVIKILVEKCNIRVFKPQYGFYEQFGPIGGIILMRVRNYIKKLEKEKNIRLICILDCKRGDIATTQAGYFQGLMGNLLNDWGIDWAPYDFDIINVTPWMGSDVMVLGSEDKPGLGLKLMRQGKCIIGVNKTSNPSGPDYQELHAEERGDTIQMSHAVDLSRLSNKFNLENDGLSTIGLVVGSTHPCGGSIRKAFPSTTLLVPGFGAQGGKFSLIMPELIRVGKWNGQGAIFSSSRGTLYPFETEYGGSGKVKNLENDLIKSIQIFREKEEEAFKQPEVVDVGIVYPFND